MVDNTPIRIYKNNEDLGVPFPDHQAMSVFASLWNGEEWATQNGAIKLNWSNAPFVRFLALSSALYRFVFFKLEATLDFFLLRVLSVSEHHMILKLPSLSEWFECKCFMSYHGWSFAASSLMSSLLYR